MISDRNFYQQNVSNMYMNLLERNFSTGEEKNVFLGMQSYLPSAEVNCVSCDCLLWRQCSGRFIQALCDASFILSVFLAQCLFSFTQVFVSVLDVQP